jgi:hypothetical protein
MDHDLTDFLGDDRHLDASFDRMEVPAAIG